MTIDDYNDYWAPALQIIGQQDPDRPYSQDVIFVGKLLGLELTGREGYKQIKLTDKHRRLLRLLCSPHSLVIQKMLKHRGEANDY